MAEMLYGIKGKKEERKSCLGQKVLNHKVNVLNDGNNLLRQKSILSNDSLLNNHVREFKRKPKRLKRY